MRLNDLMRWKIGVCLIGTTLLAGSMLATNVYAQTVPPSAEAARIEEQLRTTPAPQASAPRPSVSGLALQDAPEGADQISFALNGIEIRGNSVYTDEELAALYRDRIGQEIPLSWLFELANAITVKYRNDGYVLSRVIVPQQEIRDGRVRLEIVEGYVSNVIVQGADGLKSKAQIERYANAITRKRPANMADIERYLLLIRDMPGHTVDSLLRPSADSKGGAELVLQVAFKPTLFSAGIDNYGSKFLGPVQTNLRAQGNSLLQGGDQTVLRYVGSGTAIPVNQVELRYFNASHGMLLNGEGTMLTLSASRIISYPGNRLHFLDTKSQSLVLTTEVAHPFIRSRLTNLSGNVQFDMVNATNKLLGSVLADDRIRALRLGGTFDHMDNWQGVTQLSLETSLGLDIFGASKTSSPELSRARGESSFKKVNIDAARVQRLNQDFNLYTGIRGQYSQDRLLSSEEFGVGGSEFGRGYDSSEITGDRGIAGRLELQYNGYTGWETVNGYQAFAFYDVGKVFQSDGKDGRDASLASVGAGVRFNVTDHASASLSIAKPLTKQVDTRSDNGHEKPLRGLFSFVVRY